RIADRDASRSECGMGQSRPVPEAASVQDRIKSGAVCAPAPALVVRGLWREFGETPVLRDVAFELSRGGTLAVLGPNGAGKTTLLRMLATLLRPTAGEVSVLGCSLPREAWRARGRIGFLGDEPLLYRDLTGAENLRFQARLHSLPGDAAERAAELLDRVGMSRRAKDLVPKLSGR